MAEARGSAGIKAAAGGSDVERTRADQEWDADDISDGRALGRSRMAGIVMKRPTRTIQAAARGALPVVMSVWEASATIVRLGQSRRNDRSSPPVGSRRR